MRLIDISVPEEGRQRLSRLIEEWPKPIWTLTADENGRMVARAVLPDADCQPLIDAVQAAFDNYEGWRAAILPVEATICPKNTESPEPEDKPGASALREEIYQDVAEGGRFDANFIILTVLSAIVAAIGMSADSVAVVIGAMVIAPLLGPLLAFSFGSALGDGDLMVRSGRTALAGLGIGAATAFLIGALIDINLQSKELLDRTNVGLDSIALALASGGAAALSISRGLSSTLVGVMVAVALLPPSVAAATFLGAGELALAGRAGVLLAVNIVSVNIASQLVFILKGVRPRTWLEQRSAKRSRMLNLFVWGGLLAALTLLVPLALNR